MKTESTMAVVSLQSPIGEILLTAENNAVTGLYMNAPLDMKIHLDRNVQSRSDDFTATLKANLQKTSDKQSPLYQNNSNILQKATRQLQEYFAGKLRSFELTWSLAGTAFQQSVWQAICDIPYGESRSYGEVAKMINHPKAARAVGMALNKNPLGIIVPCHRVVGSGGKLTGYAGGLPMKRWLLDLESHSQ